MSLMVDSFSLIQPSLHPIPSMNLFWGCLGLGIAFAWAIVGGDAPVHHTKGKLHIENSEQQASSMYASGGIYLDVHCGRVFVNCISTHVCMCVCARVYTVYVLTLLHNLHTYIAWLRLPKETKHWRVCRATSS